MRRLKDVDLRQRDAVVLVKGVGRREAEVAGLDRLLERHAQLRRIRREVPEFAGRRLRPGLAVGRDVELVCVNHAVPASVETRDIVEAVHEKFVAAIDGEALRRRQGRGAGRVRMPERFIVPVDGVRRVARRGARLARNPPFRLAVGVRGARRLVLHFLSTS